MYGDSNQVGGIIAAVIGVYVVFYLIQALIFIIPTWFISKKAGFSPWLSLLCLFPLTGLILLYVLAFAEWKVVPAPPPVWQQQPPYPPRPPYPPQG
jgi:hypothetical protein